MGGIERIIEIDDIVILKPNAQWRNQGRTDLAAMKSFMDLVLNIPNFNSVGSSDLPARRGESG